MVHSRYGSNRSLKLAVSYDLREGSFEALFNIRGALDRVMDGAVSVFSLDDVIDQDSGQFSGNFPPFPGHRTM